MGDPHRDCAGTLAAPLVVNLFGNEVASRSCIGVLRLWSEPSPMIAGTAAAYNRDFCSLERHAYRFFLTKAEPVNARQNADAPHGPAHKADHAAHEGSHFMSAPVLDAANGESPNNQTRQYGCAKTEQFEPGPRCNIAWPIFPHQNDQCSGQKQRDCKRQQQLAEKGWRHNWSRDFVFSHELQLLHAWLKKTFTREPRRATTILVAAAVIMDRMFSVLAAGDHEDRFLLAPSRRSERIERTTSFDELGWA